MSGVMSSTREDRESCHGYKGLFGEETSLDGDERKASAHAGGGVSRLGE